MDASRPRRKKDPARRAWYARHRQIRFARHYGFVGSTAKSLPNDAVERPQGGGLPGG